MSLSWQCICVDCADHRALASWWAELLGWRVTVENDEEAVIEPPVGSPLTDLAPDILFLRVPEKKTFKNRLHMDLRPDDQAAEVARAEALGATKVDVGQGDPSWVVMADPEGNEFCIVRAYRPGELA